jgi:hypothetical protein
MPLADDQNMIQALTPKRSDQAFSIWVLRLGGELQILVGDGFARPSGIAGRRVCKSR